MVESMTIKDFCRGGCLVNLPTIIVPLLGAQAENAWCMLTQTFHDRLHCVIKIVALTRDP